MELERQAIGRGSLQPRLMAEASSDCTHKASMVSSLLYSRTKGDGVPEAFSCLQEGVAALLHWVTRI